MPSPHFDGNPDRHVILRGGRSNYGATDIARVSAAAANAGIARPVMVDCSRGNSNKDHTRQAAVCRGVLTRGQNCSTEVSMVKLYGCNVANKVAYECVQLHGGYGYMREFPIERFYRDVRMSPIAGGTAEIMREIIVRRGLDRDL